MKPVSRIADLTTKRLQDFHSKMRGFCSSQRHFEKHVEVDMGHIIREGHKKNPQRLSLAKQDIAAIIQQGALNVDRSHAGQGGQPLAIAVEGKISGFKWLDLDTMKEIEELLVQVRVVVRDRKPKTLVVTAYVLNPAESREFVEVNREIW